MAKKVIFDEVLLKQIETDYNAGKSILTIATEIHSTEKTVSKKLKELGVQVINKRFITQETLDIVKERLKNESLTKICKDLHISSYNISKKLKEQGVKIINRQNQTKFDENIFDCIDTEEKAYWLGFLYADGCIDSSPLYSNKKSYYSFGLSLQIRDINHLIKFNKFMKHNKNNIITYTKDPVRPCCRWCVRNKHLWETLNNYGHTPQKSLTLKFPDFSIFKDKSLIRHFIRGYFDGDGCFTYDREHNKELGYYLKPRLGFIGTKMFLSELSKQIGIDCRWSHDKRNKDVTWMIWYNREESYELMRWLYDNCSTYLDRKYELYKLFKNKKCCSLEEFNELLSGNIGENPEMDNTEINSEIAKGSESLYSVESE